MGNHIRRAIVSAAILLIINVAPSFSQERVDWTISLDRPQLPSTGFRLNISQFQLGFNLGYLPGFENEILFPTRVVCFSLNSYYHFAGTSKYVTMRPWYLMTGVTFEKDKWKDFNEEEITDRYTLLNVRAGREFNINRVVALGGEAGAIYMLKSPYEFEEGEHRWDFGFSLNVIFRIMPKEVK